MQVGDTLLKKAFHAGGHSIDSPRFTNIGKTPAETVQSKPQTSNTVGTSQDLTLPPTARPLTFRPALIGYALVPRAFLAKVLKWLCMVLKK